MKRDSEHTDNSEKKPKFSALLDSFSAPTILVDMAYRIQASNRAYRETFGLIPHMGHSRCFEVSHSFGKPCDQEGESCPLLKSLDTGVNQRVMHVHQSPEGPEYVDVELRPIRDKEGVVRHFLEILTPIRVASAQAATTGMVGFSASFQAMLDQVRRVADSRTAVLLTGESGSGKEVVARAIHDASPRYNQPFVPVECSGLTENLFESELFGHERGAFTGAHIKKIGLVELAHKGTLFLDEIGDVPLSLQVKLLRLLETNTFRRVGGLDPLHSDFRLICATNRDLGAMLESREFRLDLYYRISVFPISLPPLRQRKADLPMLIDSLLKRLEGKRRLKISPDALRCLNNYDFPGNIRELQNMLERARHLMDGDVIEPEHLPGACREGIVPPTPKAAFELDEVIPLEEMERLYLDHVMTRFGLHKNELATRLGISPRTLYRKLRPRS